MNGKLAKGLRATARVFQAMPARVTRDGSIRYPAQSYPAQSYRRVYQDSKREVR